MNKNYNMHQIFAKHLIEKIEDRLSWRNDEIINQAPEEAIFLGAFSEIDAKQNENGVIFPNHIGLQFKIDMNRVKIQTDIEINFMCDFFYRISPSYEEQINHIINYYISESGYLSEKPPTLDHVLIKKFSNYINQSMIIRKQFSTVFFDTIGQIIEMCSLTENPLQNFKNKLEENFTNDEIDVINEVYQNFLSRELHEDGLVIKKREIALKYKKFVVNEYPRLKIHIDKNTNVQQSIKKSLDAFNMSFNNLLHDEILGIKDILSTTKRPRICDIVTEEKFQAYLTSSKIEEIPYPNWQVKVDIQAIVSNQTLLLDVIFSNQNKVSDSSKTSISYPYSTKIYNAKIIVYLNRNDYTGSNSAFEKFDITDLISSYRYDTSKYGKSSNSGINHSYVEGKDILETVNFSLYAEKRRITRPYKDISLKFKDFADNSIMHLQKIANALKLANQDVYEYINTFKNNSKVYHSAFDDYENLTLEIKRFEFGIECIKLFSNAHKAFIYLNESFALESDQFDSWRLFQIVFIVSNIPDMIVSEYGAEELSAIQNYKIEDMVDILYFSTGGGKTEAFLGCVLFSLFFDRLRGKTKGITAIIKYPLRLLSIQQVDRVIKKLTSAQIIKSKYDLPGEEFSLGYFVGGGNTPNSIKSYEDVAKEIDEFEEQFQQIYECPLCKSKVKLKVDINHEFIYHYCMNPQCAYHQKLPYSFIDDEIYRHIPSVLISTLDKFAVMAINNNFNKLLCIKDDGSCSCYDPAPTLSIIDEIHLIKESLGTFSSHYESIFYYYCSDLIRDFGAKSRKIKYMGATATISNYKYQVKELFMKDAHLFPAISPMVKKDFYSYVDETDVTRFNVAVMPFGISPIEYLLRLIKAQREIVAQYLEDPSELITLFNNELSEQDIIQLLYDYYIIIQYSNTKRDASRIRNGVDAFINSSINVKEKYKVPTDTILTGDTKFDKVKSLLSDIAKSKNPVDDPIPNYITATSMISHGVDNDKFNNIFFLGLPNLFAEYIQAYSRVGRKYSGIVFSVIRPIRLREESFLTNFIEYMDYKELMVSPVPISRYSIGGLRKTFNGVLMAIVRLYALPRSKQTRVLVTYKHFRDILLEIREKPLAKILKMIYSHHESEGSDYNQMINQLVKETFVFLYSSSNDQFNKKKIGKVIKYINSTNEIPMRSLRDTDKPVIIGLKEDKNG
jgi:hypothetical protein